VQAEVISGVPKVQAAGRELQAERHTVKRKVAYMAYSRHLAGRKEKKCIVQRTAPT